MKQLSTLSLCLFIATISFAQNAGINDQVPIAKLTVKGAETTPDGQGAIKLQNTVGVQFIYRKSIHFLNEMYISAPGIINFNVLSSFNPGAASLNSSNHFGKISGYLISD
jgi:hypothetical protein